MPSQSAHSVRVVPLAEAKEAFKITKTHAKLSAYGKVADAILNWPNNVEYQRVGFTREECIFVTEIEKAYTKAGYHVVCDTVSMSFTRDDVA